METVHVTVKQTEVKFVVVTESGGAVTKFFGATHANREAVEG